MNEETLSYANNPLSNFNILSFEIHSTMIDILLKSLLIKEKLGKNSVAKSVRSLLKVNSLLKDMLIVFMKAKEITNVTHVGSHFLKNST